jgi:DNA-binding transcriptional ArsR family regulator
MSTAQEIARVFNALGDPTRRAILERVSEGPVSISSLAKPLKITLAAVVQHIQVLEAGELVRTEKVGRVRTCALHSKGLDVISGWIADRKSLWERRLDRLGTMLDEDG